MKDCTQKIFFIPVGCNEVLPSCSCHLINKTLCIVHNDSSVFCCVQTPSLVYKMFLFFSQHVLRRLLTNWCGFLLCDLNLRYVTYTIIQQRRSRTQSIMRSTVRGRLTQLICTGFLVLISL